MIKRRSDKLLGEQAVFLRDKIPKNALIKSRIDLNKHNSIHDSLINASHRPLMSHDHSSQTKKFEGWQQLTERNQVFKTISNKIGQKETYHADVESQLEVDSDNDSSHNSLSVSQI